jgi:hypothetical protein
VSGRPTNPEATDHGEVVRAALSKEVPPYVGEDALDALLTERDALKKERDEWKQACDTAIENGADNVDRLQATLTRYRNALEIISHSAFLGVRNIARAALDGPKEEET